MNFREYEDVEVPLIKNKQKNSHNAPVTSPITLSALKAKHHTTAYSLQITGFIFGALYILYLNVKLENFLLQKTPWIYSNIPLSLFLAAFTARAHQFVHNPRQQMKKLGRLIITTLVYSTDILLCIFNLLVCLQADRLITIRYLTMFSPLLVLSAIMYFFICFITPGFLDTENQFYKEAFLLITYYTAGLTTVIFLSLKLDDLIAWQYTSLLTPLFSAFGMHGLYIFIKLFDKKVKTDLREIIILLALTAFFALTAIKNDRMQQNKDFSWVLVLTPVYLLFVAEVLWSAALLVRKRRKSSRI